MTNQLPQGDLPPRGEAMARRPRRWRWSRLFVTLAAGPPLAMTFIMIEFALYQLVTTGHSDDLAQPMALLLLYPIQLVQSYVFGIFPALIIGIALASTVGRLPDGPARVAVSTVIGAFSTFILFQGGHGEHAWPVIDRIGVIVAGGLATFLCALFCELFETKVPAPMAYSR
jgi:hypothetical protein